MSIPFETIVDFLSGSMAAGTGESNTSNGADETKNMVNGKAPTNAVVNLKAKITGLPSSYCLEVSRAYFSWTIFFGFGVFNVFTKINLPSTPLFFFRISGNGYLRSYM